jgi:putative pyruvate formate lyase activating enzyme
MEILNLLESCKLCPRKCGVNRLKGALGYCKAGYSPKVAKAMLHTFEEPCISSGSGSGAVFFSNCSISCVFCQNYDISQEHIGKDVTIDRLSHIYLELQHKGACNINLVSPTHYVPQIIESLSLAKAKGLILPVVYNSNGYEHIEILRYLKGLVDIYLPDIKYFSDKYAVKYSNVREYFKHASSAVLEMYSQVGAPIFEGDALKRGLVIRHLLLPGLLSDSKKILDWIAENLPKGVYISLMSQYLPIYKAQNFPEINRKISQKSYEWLVDYALSLGLENGFMQEFDSADTIYTPEFNLEGV